MNDTVRKIAEFAEIVKEIGKDELKKGSEILMDGVDGLVAIGSEAMQGQGGEILRKGSEVLEEQGRKLRNEAVKLMDDMDRRKVWSGYEDIVTGSAPDTVIPGCLVLEGGSFRGVYTSGVLDVLMENGINMEATIGTSAGALNGYNYVAGQIGRSAQINLGYRHDHRYLGTRTTVKNHGVIGFRFILNEIEEELPFDHDRFDSPDRRFVVTVTDCETGEVIYCEKGQCEDMVRAVQASASMPFVSEMVPLGDKFCLDGGCAVKIPYLWAMQQGYEKILVIRTRPQKYRRAAESARFCEVTDKVYRNHPQLAEKLKQQSVQYNTACDELDRLDAEGRIKMLCPSGSIVTGTLEGDMEKLGALYLLGRRDAEIMLPEIREYLGM